MAEDRWIPSSMAEDRRNPSSMAEDLLVRWVQSLFLRQKCYSIRPIIGRSVEWTRRAG